VSAKTRYVERHYKRVRLKKTFWASLKKLADEKNMSVPELIQELYQHYITCNCRQVEHTTTSTSSSVPPQNCGGGIAS
jgi:predicted DNA-binding ribbon-helix-helix protein